MPKSIRSEGLLELGKAIVEYRAQNGLSQRDLASRVGYRQSFISKLELGVRRLDIVEFVIIARAIGLDTHDLLSRIERAVPKDQKI